MRSIVITDLGPSDTMHKTPCDRDDFFVLILQSKQSDWWWTVVSLQVDHRWQPLLPLRLLPPLSVSAAWRCGIKYQRQQKDRLHRRVPAYYLTAMRCQFMTAPISAPVSQAVVSALTAVYQRSRYLVLIAMAAGISVLKLECSRGFESKSAHLAAKFMPTREPHGGSLPEYSKIQGL